MNFTMSRDKFESARARLSNEGIAVSGDSGTITSRGVSVTFEYREPALSITVLDYAGYPRWIVNHSIKGWFSHA